MKSNGALSSKIKIDLIPVEADQVASASVSLDPNNIDGVILDNDGNPIQYEVLVAHPGGNSASMNSTKISSKNMIHYFRKDRPGQHRGIPELTPALPLFAQLRRFTLSALNAAEFAANFAGVITTENPASSESSLAEAMDRFELERGMVTVLPDGYKLGQVQAVQPTTTYSEFKKEILNEIARCFNMPFNIAAGNSSSYYDLS